MINKARNVVMDMMMTKLILPPCRSGVIGGDDSPVILA